MESSSSSKWCNLPSEILLSISKILHGNYDYQLRAVCTSWNTSFPSKPHSIFPLEVPCPVIPTPEDKEQVLSFSKRFRFYLVQRSVLIVSPLKKEEGTSPAWITKVEKTGVKEQSVFNPLTGNRISPDCFLNKPRYINLLDFSVSEITKAYSILWVDKEGCYHTHSCSPAELSGCIHIKKVITFHVNGDGIIILLVLHDDGKLISWKFGCEEWKMVDSDSKFVDIISFDGNFCAVDMQGNLMVFDPLTVKPIKIAALPSNVLCDHDMAAYLVQCEKYLYLVKIVYINFSVEMTCFVLTEKGWVDNGGFGPKANDVFFLGNDVTYCLSPKQLGWTRGNFAYHGGELKNSFNSFMSKKFNLFEDNHCGDSLRYNINKNYGSFTGVYDYKNIALTNIESNYYNNLFVKKIFLPPLN